MTTKKKTVKKTAVKKVPKPRKKSRSDYDWNDIVDYIQKKYGKDIRDWAGKYSNKSKHKKSEEIEYQDFWLFMCDVCEIHNGSVVWLFPGDWAEDETCPPWRKEICKILVKEFGFEFQAYVSW